MIGEAVRDLLRAEHYAVDWATDGDMADAALAAQPYDLVLLDLGLPRRDGLAVLRALRARKDRTPVLIATARDGVAQRVEGLDAGADDYVLKPYDLDDELVVLVLRQGVAAGACIRGQASTQRVGGLLHLVIKQGICLHQRAAVGQQALHGGGQRNGRQQEHQQPHAQRGGVAQPVHLGTM